MFHNSWCNYAIKFNSHITCLDLRNQKFGVSENWIITILSDQIKYMNNPRRFWNSEVAEVPIDLQRERKRERAKARSSDWDRITILRSISRFWDEASCDSRSICEETASWFCDEAICEEAILFVRKSVTIQAICEEEVIMRLSDLCGSDFEMRFV